MNLFIFGTTLRIRIVAGAFCHVSRAKIFIVRPRVEYPKMKIIQRHQTKKVSILFTRGTRKMGTSDLWGKRFGEYEIRLI